MKLLTTTLIIISSILITSINTASATPVSDQEMKQRGNNEQHSKRRGPPAFSELDLDQNGSITLEEFSQHKIPMGAHSDIFAKIDSNEDGSISKEELESHKPPKPRKRR